MHMNQHRVAVLLLFLSAPAFAVSYAESAPGVNGFTAVDRISWLDSKGLTRELYFARTYPNPIVPQIMGYVTRLTWQPDASSPRIIAEEDPSGINASNAQGWGINVMHMHWLQFGGVHPVFGSGASATTNKRDGFNFVQGPAFQGPHHLIYRITFKQYTMLVRDPGPRPYVYVTIDWFISDGLDHVVYAITLDASRDYQSNSVHYLNNCLAPYSLAGAAAWKGTTDWAGGSGAPDGESWGDFKTFLTNDNRNWTYGGTNRVPFIWQWVTPSSGRGDAEAAYVQTETYSQKRAGESFAQGRDASGTRLPVYPDLNGEEYAYQLRFFDNYNSKRLTWGTRFGLLYGGGGATPGYQNYSVAFHLGKHTDHGARSLLDETAGLHDGTIRVQATVGSLVSSGPEGSGNPTPHTYSPRGYNQVYRTWEVQSVGNTVALSFDVGTLSYRSPVFVVHGYTGSSVNGVTVRLNGAVLPSTGYAASLDDAGDKLYVTLLSTLSGANSIQIHDAQTPPLSVASVTVSPSTSTVRVNSSVTFTATARDAAGTVLPNESITWSAPGAAGSFNGDTFTSTCALGTYTVTALATNGISGTAAVEVVAGLPARLIVSPAESQVRSRETRQYSVVVRDSCDNVLTGQAVSWSAAASAGTISQTGLFSASCTRAVYPSGVTATLASLHSSAAVSVIAGAPYAIDVIPSSVSLPVGGTQQFSAAVRDECGNAVSDGVDWGANATAGTITTGGAFTASGNPGSHPNSVTAEIGAVMGSASVTLIAPAVDAGVRDAGLDAGVADAGVRDAGVDAGVPDAGIDAGVADAGIDAGVADAGIDAGVADAGVDAGVPDAGGIDASTGGGGGGGGESTGGGAGGGANTAPDAGAVAEKLPTFTAGVGELDLPASGCACNTSDAALFVLGLLALLRRRHSGTRMNLRT
jgi:MYXO-CTERM domain-containing protein